jgi:GAF domain-containing protein
MGEATLERALREVAATLVADAPLAETVQRIADLSCDLGLPAVAAELQLVDGRGRPTQEVRTGVPATDGRGDGSPGLLSLPLAASGHALGTITLYADEAGAFTDADASTAHEFAAQAAVVLANARAYWELHDLAAGLQVAMQSRAVIEQAKGRVMATEGCTADEAFTILAKASQHDNIKLRELARQVVDGEHDGRFARP